MAFAAPSADTDECAAIVHAALDSGIDLIEAMQKDAALAAIPVLAVTAYAGKGDEERIRDAGAEGYLAKPVSIGPFMAAVNGLL